MAIDVPKEPLRELVATLAGLPVKRVYWSGEAEKMVGPIMGVGAKLTLSVIARESNGWEEIRRELNEDTNELTEEIGAHRTLTISIRADNFLKAGEAFDTLERLRLRMARLSSRAAFRLADLAYVDAPSIVDLDVTVDGRMLSAASLDVRVAQVVSEVDPTGGSWIEKVTSKSAEEVPDVAAAPIVDIAFTRVD